jgi:hypothetical protein
MIRFKSFMTEYSTDNPDTVRRDAACFANKVLMDDTNSVSEGPSKIINITENLCNWGCVVTVWYDYYKEISK